MLCTVLPCFESKRENIRKHTALSSVFNINTHTDTHKTYQTHLICQDTVDIVTMQKNEPIQTNELVLFETCSTGGEEDDK